ncbi:MAG TPA: hypothetical protein V6C52_06960 [Coleofasciculaceae cyanobacterium]
MRFGFWGSPLLTNSLTFLERNPLGELVFKDVTGFNLPKIALVRTQEERPDVATLELSNTGITLLSSLILPRVLRYPVSWFSGISRAELRREIPRAAQIGTATSLKLARMGNALGFFFPFASAFWAAPFFRNWLTLKRTQAKGYSYEQMIGLGEGDANRSKRSPESEMRYQKGMAGKIFGIGSALGAASLLLFSLAARGAASKTAGSVGRRLAAGLEKTLQRPWRWFYDRFELKGEGASQIASGAATVLFWGLPAYAGWLHAARSGNEFKERLVQAGVGLFGFSFVTMLTDKLWNKAFFKHGADNIKNWTNEFRDVVRSSMLPGEDFNEKFKSMAASPSHEQIEKHFTGQVAKKGAKEALIRLQNMKYAIGSLAIPFAILSVAQLANFRLTRKREEKKRRQQVATRNMALSRSVFPAAGNVSARTLSGNRSGYTPAPTCRPKGVPMQAQVESPPPPSTVSPVVPSVIPPSEPVFSSAQVFSPSMPAWQPGFYVPPSPFSINPEFRMPVASLGQPPFPPPPQPPRW